MRQQIKAQDHGETHSHPAVGVIPARAKRIIFLTQSGGPSQIELYDHKPGRSLGRQGAPPDDAGLGTTVDHHDANQKQLIMPARTTFERCGQSGATIGEWMPHLKKVADELCFIKSMTTQEINHAPAMTHFLTGHQIPGRPSFGE